MEMDAPPPPALDSDEDDMGPPPPPAADYDDDDAAPPPPGMDDEDDGPPPPPGMDDEDELPTPAPVAPPLASADDEMDGYDSDGNLIESREAAPAAAPVAAAAAESDEEVPEPTAPAAYDEPVADTTVPEDVPTVHGTYEKPEDEEEIIVKTEFVWADGAENDVKLSGSWNGWMPVQMYHEGGGMWSVVTPVPAGTHEFKFVVDGEWKHSTRHPTVGDDEETMNNIRVIRGPPKNQQQAGGADQGTRGKEKGGCCVIS